MRYKIGDLVIKKTGGNKMVVDSSNDGLYSCIWFVGGSLNESLFKEEDIISVKDYDLYLKIEERHDKIGKLLK